MAEFKKCNKNQIEDMQILKGFEGIDYQVGVKPDGMILKKDISSLIKSNYLIGRLTNDFLKSYCTYVASFTLTQIEGYSDKYTKLSSEIEDLYTQFHKEEGKFLENIENKKASYFRLAKEHEWNQETLDSKIEALDMQGFSDPSNILNKITSKENFLKEEMLKSSKGKDLTYKIRLAQQNCDKSFKTEVKNSFNMRVDSANGLGTYKPKVEYKFFDIALRAMEGCSQGYSKYAKIINIPLVDKDILNIEYLLSSSAKEDINLHESIIQYREKICMLIPDRFIYVPENSLYTNLNLDNNDRYHLIATQYENHCGRIYSSSPLNSLNYKIDNSIKIFNKIDQKFKDLKDNDQTKILYLAGQNSKHYIDHYVEYKIRKGEICEFIYLPIKDGINFNEFIETYSDNIVEHKFDDHRSQIEKFVEIFRDKVVINKHCRDNKEFIFILPHGQHAIKNTNHIKDYFYKQWMKILIPTDEKYISSDMLILEDKALVNVTSHDESTKKQDNKYYMTIIMGTLGLGTYAALKKTNQVPGLQQQLQQAQAEADQVPGLQQQLQQAQAEADQVPELQQQLQQAQAEADQVPELQQQLQQAQLQGVNIAGWKDKLQEAQAEAKKVPGLQQRLQQALVEAKKVTELQQRLQQALVEANKVPGLQQQLKEAQKDTSNLMEIFQSIISKEDQRSKLLETIANIQMESKKISSLDSRYDKVNAEVIEKEREKDKINDEIKASLPSKPTSSDGGIAIKNIEANKNKITQLDKELQNLHRQIEELEGQAKILWLRNQLTPIMHMKLEREADVLYQKEENLQEAKQRLLTNNKEQIALLSANTKLEEIRQELSLLKDARGKVRIEKQQHKDALDTLKRDLKAFFNGNSALDPYSIDEIIYSLRSLSFQDPYINPNPKNIAHLSEPEGEEKTLVLIDTDIDATSYRMVPTFSEVININLDLDFIAADDKKAGCVSNACVMLQKFNNIQTNKGLVTITSNNIGHVISYMEVNKKDLYHVIPEVIRIANEYKPRLDIQINHAPSPYDITWGIPDLSLKNIISCTASHNFQSSDDFFNHQKAVDQFFNHLLSYGYQSLCLNKIINHAHPLSFEQQHEYFNDFKTIVYNSGKIVTMEGKVINKEEFLNKFNDNLNKYIVNKGAQYQKTNKLSFYIEKFYSLAIITAEAINLYKVSNKILAENQFIKEKYSGAIKLGKFSDEYKDYIKELKIEYHDLIGDNGEFFKQIAHKKLKDNLFFNKNDFFSGFKSLLIVGNEITKLLNLGGQKSYLFVPAIKIGVNTVDLLYSTAFKENKYEVVETKEAFKADFLLDSSSILGYSIITKLVSMYFPVMSQIITATYAISYIASSLKVSVCNSEAIENDSYICTTIKLVDYTAQNSLLPINVVINNMAKPFISYFIDSAGIFNSLDHVVNYLSNYNISIFDEKWNNMKLNYKDNPSEFYKILGYDICYRNECILHKKQIINYLGNGMGEIMKSANEIIVNENYIITCKYSEKEEPVYLQCEDGNDLDNDIALPLIKNCEQLDINYIFMEVNNNDM